MTALLRPLMEIDGRDAADVVAATLVDWLDGVVSTKTLRVIAEEIVGDLIKHSFVAVPIDQLEHVARFLDERAGA